MVEPSPLLRGQIPRFSSSPIDEMPFGMLSEAEEREISRAWHAEHEDSDAEGGHGTYRHDDMHSDAGSTRTYQSRSGDDLRELRERERRQLQFQQQLGRAHPDQMSFGGGIQSAFDFAHMDEFAASERRGDESEAMPVAGLTGAPTRRSTSARRRSPIRPAPGGEDVSGSGSSTRQDASLMKGSVEGESKSPASPFALGDAGLERTPTADLDAGAGEPTAEDNEPVQTNFHRRRARKLSQSNPVRRQAKLALFESFGGGGGDDTLASGALKAPRQGKQFVEPPPAFTAYTDTAPGHDRPYRFSFYSNALPVTIHARTLAELPAEGQSFEDLFKGRNNAADVSSAPPPGGDFGTPSRSGRNTPNEPSLLSQQASKIKGLQASLAKTASTNLAPTAEEDPDAYTWWLDVLSPTDEEMRMLSKVFGIHPLTTEDILLEETREKIELFRHYYLVCFRSFDQDPYSQTYLEPLNMYIIVFREGTLSVSN